MKLACLSFQYRSIANCCPLTFCCRSIALKWLLVVFWVVSNCALASDDACPFNRLTDQVYFIAGSNAQTCPAQKLQHPVTNPVAIIGQTGVVLVDPGSSEAVGKLVLYQLSKITDKPVVAIINTHIHGLYWLANHAIKLRYPALKIYAHPRMIQRINNGEGQAWIDQFFPQQATGSSAAFSAPEISLEDGEILNLNGVMLKIHEFSHAHTDHDVAIEIVKDKILIVGGLVVEPEVPSQGVPQDANFKGQMAAIQRIIDMQMRSYIPGQGYPQGAQLPRRSLQFLSAIYDSVKRGYGAGMEDYEITAQLKLELAHFTKWYDFSALGRVVSEIWLQVEQDDFSPDNS